MPWYIEMYKEYCLIARAYSTKNKRAYIVYEKPVKVEGSNEEIWRKAIEKRGKRPAIYILTDAGEILPMHRRWTAGEAMLVEVK